MPETPPRLPLSRPERMGRICILAGLALAALAVYFVFPAGAKTCVWFKLAGLPCLFCGMTRASHCLMHGDWAGACYYNALVYPAALGAGAACLLVLAELVSGRVLVPWLEWVPHVRWGWALPLAVAGTLWAWHIRGAVATPKPELLNPSAPAYPWLSKLAGPAPAQPEATHE